MKILFYVLAVFVMTGSIFYYGCDDSGQIPVEEKAGQVKLTQSINLPPLDPVNDGYYNLFVILTDSFGTPRASHLGRFNVLASGQIVDISGNPMTLALNPNDTIDLGRSVYSIISIDIGVVNQPGPTRIVAGPVTVHADSITARLLINDTLAIGSAMTYALGPGSVFYIVNTPTSGAGNCGKGLWLCDQDGFASWPVNAVLNPGWGWQYRGWVHNKSTNEYYTTGAFYDPNGPDLDGAGPCADTGTAYGRPGQDFVQTGCSSLSNILDGNHEAFVTVEPESRGGNIPPFVLKLYAQANIVPSVSCNRRDNMFTQRQGIPDVSLRVTR